MKTTSIAASLLLAGSTLAVPTSMQDKMYERRVARRSSKPHNTENKWKTGNPLKVHWTDIEKDRVVLVNRTEAQYDSNWAGAVQTTTGVTQVTGTWTVPTIQAPSGASSGDSYGAAIWVGIDGDSCQSAILQTGISMTIQSGSAQYAGWYEWFPNPSYNYGGFSVSPGDQIRATVISTSTVSGTAQLENLSNGQSVSQDFSNMGDVGSLCNEDAEWIVEDFEEGGSLVSFANFGDVQFTGASFQSNGNTQGVSGSTILDVEDSNGNVVTNCGTSGSSGVQCQYTGN